MQDITTKQAEDYVIDHLMTDCGYSRVKILGEMLCQPEGWGGEWIVRVIFQVDDLDGRPYTGDFDVWFDTGRDEIYGEW